MLPPPTTRLSPRLFPTAGPRYISLPTRAGAWDANRRTLHIRQDRWRNHHDLCGARRHGLAVAGAPPVRPGHRQWAKSVGFLQGIGPFGARVGLDRAAGRADDWGCLHPCIVEHGFGTRGHQCQRCFADDDLAAGPGPGDDRDPGRRLHVAVLHAADAAFLAEPDHQRSWRHPDGGAAGGRIHETCPGIDLPHAGAEPGRISRRNFPVRFPGSGNQPHLPRGARRGSQKPSGNIPDHGQRNHPAAQHDGRQHLDN